MVKDVDTKQLERYVKKVNKRLSVDIGWDNKIRKNAKNKRQRSQTSWGSARTTNHKKSAISNGFIALMLLKRGYKFFEDLYKPKFLLRFNYKFLQDYYNKPNISKAEQRWGNLSQAMMKRAILVYNGKKNKASTIRAKGSNKPAKDTLQFLQSTKVLRK